VRKAQGESTRQAAEIGCHINTAGCKGMATTVMTANHHIWSRDTCMIAWMLHESQKASTSVVRSTNNLT